MKDILQKFKQKKPTIVFEWSDEDTGAEGWVVINSLRGGAAGGGTRMRKGLDRTEVEALAKTMEIKFTVSGPEIGGAKSGINFDPNDPRKDEVLQKWYKAVIPLLKEYYGTGGDLNIDEIKEVIPITEGLGLWHPQEGVVTGHFRPEVNEKSHLIGQLRIGVSKVVEDPAYTPDAGRKYTVADMITGWGVAEAVVHFYDIFYNSNIKDKRVIVQGWGNVAGAAGYYLAKSGAKIIGIIDREGGIIAEEGLSLDEVRALYVNRVNNKLTASGLLSYEEANGRIWELGADIMIPGAASKLITYKQAVTLLDGGIEVLSCGANVPFKDDDVFFGHTAEYLDENTALIPDFIANCGMARTFAYLMQKDVEISDEAIFTDVSQTIRKSLLQAYEFNPKKKKIAATALDLALRKLISN